MVVLLVRHVAHSMRLCVSYIQPEIEVIDEEDEAPDRQDRDKDRDRGRGEGRQRDTETERQPDRKREAGPSVPRQAWATPSTEPPSRNRPQQAGMFWVSVGLVTCLCVGLCVCLWFGCLLPAHVSVASVLTQLVVNACVRSKTLSLAAFIECEEHRMTPCMGCCLRCSQTTF